MDINKNSQKVPNIRFKGFTDDWEQRKLGEVSDVYDGTHQTPNYQDEGVMFLSVENIKTLKSNKYISNEAFETEFKARPERGDVLMTRIGSIGVANVVETDENIAYYVSLALLKSKNLESYFLQASIHTPYVQAQIWKRTLHIAFPKKINKNEIGKVSINVPNFEEQQKVGTFLRQIDNTITLHQRKLEQLNQLKESLLQQMFPGKGETVPKLRFAGFEGDWEERKLGDLLHERNQKSIQTEEYPLVSFTVENGVTEKTERYNRNQLVSGDSDAKVYRVTKLNDIVYNPANLKFGAIDRNKYGNAVFSPIYVTFEVTKDYTIAEFIESIVTTKNFISRALKYQQGTVYERQSVGVDDFLNLTVRIPNLDEQKLIGLFLNDLNKELLLQKDKLEQLQNMKQVLIQNMFI